MTRRSQRGEHAAGQGSRWAAWRAGWERLLADVLGRDASGRASLYDVLAEPEVLEEPWTRQKLDALWVAAHDTRTAAPADTHQPVR